MSRSWHHVVVGTPYNVARSHHGIDTTWMRDGACADIGPLRVHIFFADQARSRDEKLDAFEAKTMCRGCGQQSVCLEYALEAKMQGIWGGTDEADRRRIRKQRARRAVATQAI